MRIRKELFSAALAGACLLSLAAACLKAQSINAEVYRNGPAYVQDESRPERLPSPATLQNYTPAAPTSVRLSLDEIRQRVLSNNKLLQMAALNVRSKDSATRAMQANYFPQIIGNVVYFHFNDNLGAVVSTRGRTITGPRGTPIVTLPATSVFAPLIDQNSEAAVISVVQPITDRLKVNNGVRIARADEGIAQAQLEKGTRELVSGVEQLFWGLLVAQRIRAGAVTAVEGAEELAKTGLLEARTALVEARQALQEVNNQVLDLEEQMNILLEQPASTKIELVEPPLPAALVKSAAETVELALQTSPEIREAQQTICKAQAAVDAGKDDYIPSIALTGGYMNNNMIDVVQPNIGYIGAVASYTFVDWGKRRHTIHEREALLGAANLKLRQTQDDVAKNALKAFREYEQSMEALRLAADLVDVRTEAVKTAAQPADKFKAGKDLMTAQVDLAKADLAHRIAYVKLMAIIGKL